MEQWAEERWVSEPRENFSFWMSEGGQWVVGWVCLLVVGYGPGHRPMLRKQKRRPNQATHNNPLIDSLLIFFGMKWRQTLFGWMELNKKERGESNEPPKGGTQREACRASQPYFNSLQSIHQSNSMTLNWIWCELMRWISMFYLLISLSWRKGIKRLL